MFFVEQYSDTHSKTLPLLIGKSLFFNYIILKTSEIIFFKIFNKYNQTFYIMNLLYQQY
jgi:hypothetical protein